jgi:hypothetical protein
MTESSAYGKFHVYIPNQRERRRGEGQEEKMLPNYTKKRVCPYHWVGELMKVRIS